MIDNAIYYQAAYTVAAVIYVGYGLSLWWRGRALTRRERAVAERAARRGDAGAGR